MSAQSLARSRRHTRATWRRVRRALQAQPHDARGFGLREWQGDAALYVGDDPVTADPVRALAIVSGSGTVAA